MEKAHKEEKALIIKLFGKNLREQKVPEETIKELCKAMNAQYIAFRKYAKSSDDYAKLIEGFEESVPTHQQIDATRREEQIIKNKKDAV